MADIAMCLNETCPLFSSCYRAQATPSEYRQSYIIIRDEEVGAACDCYIRYEGVGYEECK